MLACMNSTEDGAKTPLYCATAPDLATQSGQYYKSMQLKEPHPYARDESLAAELWERSAQWTAPWAAPLSSRGETSVSSE